MTDEFDESQITFISESPKFTQYRKGDIVFINNTDVIKPINYGVVESVLPNVIPVIEVVFSNGVNGYFPSNQLTIIGRSS